jgi:hypothetical protein
LDLLAGIDNDGVATLLIGLSQDGSHAPWLFVITKAGISNEVEQSVLPGVVNNWVRAQISA